MKKFNLTWLLLAASTFIFTNSMEGMNHDMHDGEAHHHSKHSAKMHGPIGLMGDHFHRKGESMVSIRYMKMTMDQNYIGFNTVSDQDILQLPNPYGMPNNLSVVPQDMNMDMVMLGAMYAPTNFITFMTMATLNFKSMDLKTYQPMMKRSLVGDFTTKSSDLSRFNISALFKIYDKNRSKFHAQLGFEKNIGKNDLTGKVLTPMGSFGSLVLPYGMQGGDKSYSMLSAATYTKTFGEWKLGGQIKSKINIRSYEWNFGDSNELNFWVQRDLNKISAWSLRLKYQDIESIEGLNKNIKAPVQTANPLNYGGQTLNLGIGINIMLPKGSIGLETYKPISQDLNGPQMAMNWGLQAGYHLSF